MKLIRSARLLHGLGLLILLTAVQRGYGQPSIPGINRSSLINGYHSTIAGEILPYFSVYPKYAKEALLTRCTDGKKSIEWVTEEIPATIHGDYATFTWIAAHSSGTSSGVRFFDLYINDELALTFSTSAKEYPPIWKFVNADSTLLAFEFKTKDGANDSHGMMYLRVPLSKYPSGKPLRLKVTGQAQGSNDWFMTFRYSFREKVEVQPLPFVYRSSGGKERPLRLIVLHFGNDEPLTVTIDRKRKETFKVQNGFNVIDLAIPVVASSEEMHVHACIGDVFESDTTVLIRPVKYRELYLVHHSHTDIGYSHLQEEVIRIHNSNIREALKLIDATDSFPEGSRFVWNVESSWAVENFLREATPEERSSFIKAVKTRRIDISATYANILSGLSTPEELEWITEYSQRLADTIDLKVSSAMLSDVPGMNWSMVRSLSKKGIRYFSNGPNFVAALPDRGDRIGNTLRELGDKPVWWKSPDGKDSILLWTAGKGYSSWHGTADSAVFDRGPEKIADYLNELDEKLYPYEMVQWRYNIVADNAPVDHSISQFVKEWNEKYSSPRLLLTDVTSLFERFEKKYGKIIPSVTGDFTPYWEDGAYSTAKETSRNKELSRRLAALQCVSEQHQIKVTPPLWYEAQRFILLFHEHTWGSWNSISEPDIEFTRHQWEYKRSFVDSASLIIERIEGFIRSQLEKPGYVTIVNPSDVPVTRYLEVEYSGDSVKTELRDGQGRYAIVQRLKSGKAGFLAKDLPARSVSNYEWVHPEGEAPGLRRRKYNINLDLSSGAIRSLKTIHGELSDTSRFPGLLQPVYVNGLLPLNYSLTKNARVEVIDDGPVLKRTRVHADLEGTNGVMFEFIQVSGSDLLEMSVTIDKKAIRDKESIHIAFPFDLKAAQVRIGVDDTFYMPESGQLAAANRDFYPVQRWIDVSDANRGVTISCPQGALFEIGEMVNEEKVNNGYKRWKSVAQGSASASLFLYALNNYWHTNYKADQEGEVRFDFLMKIHEVFKTSDAANFGRANGMTMLVY